MMRKILISVSTKGLCSNFSRQFSLICVKLTEYSEKRKPTLVIQIWPCGSTKKWSNDKSEVGISNYS